MNTATAPQGYTTRVPVREQSGEEFIFYAGDVITLEVKTADLNKQKGGIVTNHENLLYNGGYIPRCEITALRDHFHSESHKFVDPYKKDAMVKTYEATDGGVTKTLGVTKNALGETVPDHLLRTPVYPKQTVGVITGRREGIVRMPCSAADKDRIQRFLFPHWDKVRSANDFPATIAKLREYFVKRKAQATDALESDCADAAIRSCDEYAAFQTREINKKIRTYNQAQAKGQPYQFGARAEELFTQLGIQRPDRTAQTNAEQTGELRDAMVSLIELQKMQMQGKSDANTEDKSAEIAEMEAAQMDVVKENPAEAVEVEAIVLCAAITGSGERCKNSAEANGYCKHAAHQKIANEMG